VTVQVAEQRGLTVVQLLGVRITVLDAALDHGIEPKEIRAV
jgi:hypothetical protein